MRRRKKPFSSMSLTGCMLLTSALLGASLSASAHEDLDADVVSRLQASMNYVAGMEAFSLAAHSTLEVVLLSAQKIQFDNDSLLTVQRPDRMRADRIGSLVQQAFYYDGRTLTLHDIGEGYFAKVEAPDNIDDMLDFARDQLDIVAPAGDLIATDAFEILMDGVHSAFRVGEAEINGTVCDHLAFSAPGTDLQVWIRQGDRPLPCKFVITSRDVVNAPQFSVVIDEWDQTPDTDDAVFEFEPPEDAIAIEFSALSVDEG